MIKASSAANIHCPQCSNYFKSSKIQCGIKIGRCPVCKSVVSVKQGSKIKKIKILNCSK